VNLSAGKFLAPNSRRRRRRRCRRRRRRLYACSSTLGLVVARRLPTGRGGSCSAPCADTGITTATATVFNDSPPLCMCLRLRCCLCVSICVPERVACVVCVCVCCVCVCVCERERERESTENTNASRPPGSLRSELTRASVLANRTDRDRTKYCVSTCLRVKVRESEREREREREREVRRVLDRWGWESGSEKGGRRRNYVFGRELVYVLCAWYIYIYIYIYLESEREKDMMDRFIKRILECERRMRDQRRRWGTEGGNKCSIDWNCRTSTGRENDIKRTNNCRIISV
jgi:hypothetical protein